MFKVKQFSLALIIVCGLVSATGCSMLQKSDGTEEMGDAQALPAEDAATDAVPAASADALPPPDSAALPPPDAAPPSADVAALPPPDAPPPVEAPAVADATPPPVAPPVEAPPAAEPVVAAAAPALSGDVVDYQVQPGETLMQIAFENYGDLYKWKDIYEANRDRIANPSAIPAGTVLKIEKPAVAVAIDRNGEKYLIKLGDTLGSISGEVYGTTSKWKKLWENNRQMIKDPNKIYAGFSLYYIPEAQAAPASPLANTPAAPAAPEAREPSSVK